MTRPSTRARIDWGAARAFFVAMPHPRNYPAVARQFRVSTTSVRKHARAEQWAAAAAEADRKAAEQQLARSERTVAQRHAQVLRIYDRASQLVEEALDADDPKLAIDQVFAKFPDIHRIYRLETEQATDHVALAEVQAGFRAAMRVAIETAAMVAGELLDDDQAGVLVRRFREVFLPAVNEALAIGGGE